MNLIFTVIALCGMSVLTMKFIPNVANDLQCKWMKLNFKHQRQVKKRVHTYWSTTALPYQCLENNRGQTTLIALFFALITIFVFYFTLSHITSVRKTILEREKILACTAFIEKRAIDLNNKIDELNKVIMRLRAMELSTKPIPLAGATLQTLRVTAELNQQAMAFLFLKATNLPSKNCRTSLFASLILFKHQFLKLKRDPLWRTALIKNQSYLWIKHSTRIMKLTLLRNPQSHIIGERKLMEYDHKLVSFYGSI